MIDIDTIRDESETRSGKQPVDVLMDRQWCTEEDLLEAGRALSADRDIDNAVACFQLPHASRLEPKWIPIPADKGHPYAFFRSIPCNGLAPRTQVLVSFQLWLPWQRFYRIYLDRIRVDPKASLSRQRIKIDNTLLTPAVYEAQLGTSLRRHALQLFNRAILPGYRIACRDPYAQKQKRLRCFFVMYKSGRIVLFGDNPSIETPVPQLQETRPVTSSRLQRWFRERKEPSVYEEYILNGLRQVDLGFPELAVVQTVMSLEWFANEIISHRLSTRSAQIDPLMAVLVRGTLWGEDGKLDARRPVGTMEKFKTYLPALSVSLSESTLRELDVLLKTRNDVLHHIQRVVVDRERGRWAVDVGLEVISEAMTHLAANPK